MWGAFDLSYPSCPDSVDVGEIPRLRDPVHIRSHKLSHLRVMADFLHLSKSFMVSSETKQIGRFTDKEGETLVYEL